MPVRGGIAGENRHSAALRPAYGRIGAPPCKTPQNESPSNECIERSVTDLAKTGITSVLIGNVRFNCLGGQI